MCSSTNNDEVILGTHATTIRYTPLSGQLRSSTTWFCFVLLSQKPTVFRKDIWKLTLSMVLSLAISHYPPLLPPRHSPAFPSHEQEIYSSPGASGGFASLGPFLFGNRPASQRKKIAPGEELNLGGKPRRKKNKRPHGRRPKLR